MTSEKKAIVIRLTKKKWDSKDLLNPADKDSIYNFKNVLSNYDELGEVFNIWIKYDFSNDEVNEKPSEFGITKSWFFACDCLGASLYPASVLFASISVEAALNHDLRLDKERKMSRQKWLYLNQENLLMAKNNGLPVKLLLDTNETLRMDKIQFIVNRNKMAHGDFVGFEQYHHNKPINNNPHSFESNYAPIKRHAMFQIKKARDFLIAWAEQKPELRVVGF